MAISDIITKLRIIELSNRPNYGSLLIRLEPNQNNSWCESFGTNAKDWFYNPDFIKNYKKDVVINFMYHSLLHCVLGNLIPPEGYDKDLWDICSDIEVIHTSIKLSLGSPPNEILSILNSYPEFLDKSSIEIYKLIVDNNIDISQLSNIRIDNHLSVAENQEEFNLDDILTEDENEENGITNETNEKNKSDKKDKSENGSDSSQESGEEETSDLVDEESDGDGTPSNNDTDMDSNESTSKECDNNNSTMDTPKSDGEYRPSKETVEYNPKSEIPVLYEDETHEIVDNFISQLINIPQSERDKFPGNLSRLIQEYTEPKLDWREILTNTMMSIFDKDDYNFAKPSKRSYSMGEMKYILPSQNFAKTIDICVSLDTSGSITDEIFMDFLTEIRSIIENYDDYKLHIWCIDSKIYCPKIFTPDNISELETYEFLGGGGNDFPLNWEYMKENDIVPELFVVFSDGYPVSMWGWEGYCDTIFVIRNEYEHIIAPFGMTVQMIPHDTPGKIDPENNGYIIL